MAFAVLAALAAGLSWIASVAPGPPMAGAHDVYVLDPNGNLLANGTVVVAHATALSVLRALGDSLGFVVEVQSLAAFSGCSSAYVRGIDGHSETATGGWNYYTRSAPSQPWQWQAAGADCPLPSGVQVEWCWVENDRCDHHVD